MVPGRGEVVGRHAVETDSLINDVMLVASHLAAIDGSTDGDALSPLEVVLATFGQGRLAGVVTDLGHKAGRRCCGPDGGMGDVTHPAVKTSFSYFPLMLKA